MMIERDVPVPAGDGVVLRADVFRPEGPGRYPVILSYGPYAKGLAFQEGYADQWRLMTEAHPDVARGSSNVHQNWEVVNPEKWVPDGYCCVRVDSRGAGRSPGLLDPFSPRETQDLYECIEWAAAQPWSTGKIGLNGISYYAMNQWHVAALHPPHLAAMCVWEGAARLLPGRHPPRRDPLLVLDELVWQAGHRGPARGGGEGPAPPGDRRDHRRP